MLKVLFIGTLGADAEKKVSTTNGKQFVTFRAAHNESWTDDAGQEHSTTTWVDCILQDWPRVADYLKQGTQVYCEGLMSLRVYSSAKDRCMKAGLTINVRKIELLGGRVDDVPRTLIDPNTNQTYNVEKFYNVADARNIELVDKHGNKYQLDQQGWVVSGTKAEDDGEQ